MELVGTDQLREGDMVFNGGMWLSVGRPLRLSQDEFRVDEPVVYQTSARICNWDELTEAAAKNRYGLAASVVAVSPDQRWTIQGTRSASWHRQMLPGVRRVEQVPDKVVVQAWTSGTPDSERRAGTRAAALLGEPVYPYWRRKQADGDVEIFFRPTRFFQ